jgi:Uma2 family endonuclease
MKAVQNPPTPLRGAPLWPLSVAAYRALGEAGLIPKNTELLYGFVYTKISKSPFHSFLVARLLRLLGDRLSGKFLVRSEQPVACGDSEPEPDISVVQGTESEFLNDHPHTAELVVEICITSHDYDRSKLRAYASANVKECWFVLGPEKQIEVYRQPKEGQYLERSLYSSGDVVMSTALSELTLNPEELFKK